MPEYKIMKTTLQDMFHIYLLQTLPYHLFNWKLDENDTILPYHFVWLQTTQMTHLI